MPALDKSLSSSGRSQDGPSYPLRYHVLPGNESVLMKEALERRPWWAPCSAKGLDGPWNMWHGQNGQKFDFSGSVFSGTPRKWQVVNRLENHREVCTKSGLAANIARCRIAWERAGKGPLAWAPETHVLPGGKSDKGALDKFRAAYAVAAAAGQGTTWIVKPTSLNRGNGIEVFNTLDAILGHLGSKSASSEWVVQKYIEKPALVGGRKFDIRAYALVAPDRSVYLHQEAYVRTSGTPYNLEDLSDKAAHLTNDAVQKTRDTYHAHEDHCKMGMPALAQELGLDLQGKVWPAMRECVSAVFGAALGRMNPRRLQFCWELLGLDFMLDAAGQLYLIEINTSPALFRAGPVLADLLPRVVEECVQKCVDPYLPPPPDTPPDQLPQPLDGFQRVEVEEMGGGPRGSQAGASPQRMRKAASMNASGSSGGPPRAVARAGSIGRNGEGPPVGGAVWR